MLRAQGLSVLSGMRRNIESSTAVWEARVRIDVSMEVPRGLTVDTQSGEGSEQWCCLPCMEAISERTVEERQRDETYRTTPGEILRSPRPGGERTSPGMSVVSAESVIGTATCCLAKNGQTPLGLSRQRKTYLPGRLTIERPGWPEGLTLDRSDGARPPEWSHNLHRAG